MNNIKTQTLPAPAKLNLFLHFIGRRPDGYHELQTLFQLLDYSDTLSFTLAKDKAIALETTLAVPVQENLIWRAAKLLQTQANTQQGARIHLNKVLPIGGGLGGGSSNAATTLIGLNRLWDLGLSIDELAALGRQLGADVPVFVRGNTAWGEGIGEILTPVQLPECWYLVITPPCLVSTAEIYAHPQLTRNTPCITLDEFLHKGGHNDAELVVREKFPPVAKALDWLTQFSPARLTGTGSSIFASFPTYAQANEVLTQIPFAQQSFVAKGINHSPLSIIETSTQLNPAEKRLINNLP